MFVSTAVPVEKVCTITLRQEAVQLSSLPKALLFFAQFADSFESSYWGEALQLFVLLSFFLFATEPKETSEKTWG
jgi:hypothetical protein